MKKIFHITTIILLFFANYSYAQQFPTNNFDGSINPGDFEIFMLFRVEEYNDSIVVKLYVPEQNLFGEPSTHIRFDEDTVVIHFDRLKMRIEGYFDRENYKFIGNYIQGRNAFSMDFDFLDDDDAVSFDRPQNPSEPFNYIIQEQFVDSRIDSVSLAGSLYLPDTIGKHKLAIITTGSGAPGRNELFGGHQIFGIIADYLARNGIAVFIYDERGAGKSGGVFTTNTTRTFLTDVLNLIRYFKNHDNIDDSKIGLVGHSEGALVAFKTAAVNQNDVAFIVSMAGPGVKIVELFKKQAEELYNLADIEPELRELLIAHRKEMFDAYVNNPKGTHPRTTLNNLCEKYAEKMSEEDVERFRMNEYGAHYFLSQVQSKWMAYFLKLEPQSYIVRTKCPVLVLNGDKDIQINAEINTKAIAEALKKGENESFKIKIYEGLNHIFQTAQTGTQSEYMYIQESISQEVLEDILLFIRDLE
jgi:uncharacterized protein